MDIKLKHLELHFFKGAEHLKFDFTDNVEIYGANRSGKTRIVDGWNFLLFGKNSMDAKDFSIKKLDSKNEPLHRTDHSVIGILSIDGIDTRLERIFREKWTKKRGEETAEFSGNETVYSINNVDVQQKDYNAWVESILAESLFKQLTNPAYFNSMNWSSRREMLFKIAGDVKNADIISSYPELKDFFDMLAGKSFDKFKSELSAKIKTLKEAKADIPARIDEVSRAIVPDPDYVQVQADIDKHNAKLIEIDGLINSDAEKFNKANQENQRKQNRIYEIQREIGSLQHEDQLKAEKDVNELKIKKSRLFSEIQQLKSEIAGYNDRLKERKSAKETIEKDNDDLRNKWTEINSQVFTTNANEFICGQCNRPFEASDIEAKKAEMLTAFNNQKTVRLENITKAGKGNASHIEEINKEITKFHESIEGAGFKLESKQAEHDSIIIPDYPPIEPNPQIKVLQDELSMTNALIKNVAKTDNSTLIQEKAEINNALDALKKALNVKSTNETHQTRKQELIDKEKTLSQQIANLEKQEFQCEKFTRAKVDMIEEKVNQMFSFVKFKMFERLVNGAMEETCICLINGVPYGDTNRAAQISAGADIINTLSKFYDVYAPVFYDNAEACNVIPEMNCQVIKLYVIPEVPSNPKEKQEYIDYYSEKGILLI